MNLLYGQPALMLDVAICYIVYIVGISILIGLFTHAWQYSIQEYDGVRLACTQQIVW